ncbi:MAG: class I SAM-dependent methyltransferase [Bacteroidota bacterium]
MKQNQEAIKRWETDVTNYNKFHLRIRIIAKIINSLDYVQVVDLGCATGTLRKLLKKQISYIGVDFIEPKNETDFIFYKCDFNSQSLPFEIQGVKLVVCSGLLEYVEDVDSFLKNIRLLLGNNGKLIVSYFNFNHISRRVKKITYKNLYFHPDWRGHYSLNDLKKIIFNSGFEIENILPMGNSFFHSTSVSSTITDDDSLKSINIFSSLTAHQFIFILKSR